MVTNLTVIRDNSANFVGASDVPIQVISSKYMYSGNVAHNVMVFVLSLSGNLIISDVQALDEGTYICRAENGVGKKPAADVSMVQVLGKEIFGDGRWQHRK